MILGFLSTLFGCGDGKPGLFSSNGYHIGKEKVWYRTSTGVSYNVEEVMGADPKTFEERVLKSKTHPESSASFGVDRNSIFWAETKIEGADLATFEFLCSWYSKDKNAAYYMGKRLSDDMAHFEIVSYQFVKDSKYVYFGSTVLSEDPTHFSSVGGEGSGFYKDSKKCWYDIYELKDADPITFHYLGTKTAADANRVYQEMNEVFGADLNTYQILAFDYAKDAHQVYQKSIVMAGADPATFRVLSDIYSLDAKQCYYYMTTIPNADPATFELIDEYYAKDARSVFTTGNVIEGADPTTFRVLNGSAGCSCDARFAYTMEKRINGVNPRNIPAGGKCKSCDESGLQFE